MTPLPVGPRKLCCAPVIFARLVGALFTFCAREFPAKSETREPGENIMECTSYTKLIRLTYGTNSIQSDILLATTTELLDMISTGNNVWL